MKEYSFASFQKVNNSSFQVVFEEETVSLLLEKVTDHGSTNTIESFSLLFSGPPAPFLPQQIHTLTHPRLGELQLFLVPVGQQPTGYLYEIIFNRLIN